MRLRSLIERLLAGHRRAALGLFGLVFAIWAVALLHYAAPVAGGADSSGYLNNARLLLEGRFEGDIRMLPEVPEDALALSSLSPLGFRADQANRTLESTYPFGFSLVLAPFQAFFGSRGGTLAVLVLLGLAAPLLTFHLARQTGLATEWAAFSAICLTTSAVYQMQAYQPMTDVETLVVATAVLILLLRFDLSPWNGVLLGVLLALGVLSRPANILLFIPVGVFLLQTPRRLLRSWTIILGGLPGAVFQGWLNLHLYDRLLATGYGDFSSYFDLDYVLPNLGFFVHRGLILLTPMVLLGFLFSPLVIRLDPRRLLAPGVVALSYLLFYASYFFTSEYWWYLRFILPVFPAIIILGSHAWSRLEEGVGWVLSSRGKGEPIRPGSCIFRWMPVLFSIIAILIGYQTSRRYGVHLLHLQEEAYHEAAAWLADHSSPEDVIVCMQTSGSVFYELPNPIIRWDAINPERWQKEVAPALLGKRRVFAALFPFERDSEVLVKRVPGKWSHQTDVGPVSIYELQAPDLDSSLPPP